MLACREKPIDENSLTVEDNFEDFSIIPDDTLKELQEQARQLYENTDYAIVYSMPGTSLGNVAAVPGPWLKDPKGIRDLQEWYMSHITRRDYIYKVYEHQTAIAIENLKKVKEALGNYIDIIGVLHGKMDINKNLF